MRGLKPVSFPIPSSSLADDSRKRIDEVTHEDQLLVWDFYKGEYTFEGIPALFDEYLNR